MGMNVGTSSADDDGDVMVDINTTPLIDVMLVLLIMFIITIPIQTHAVKMNTPIPNNAAPPPKPPEIIRVDIDFDGTIGWNGEVIAPGDRACQLQQPCPTSLSFTSAPTSWRPMSMLRWSWPVHSAWA